MVLPSIRGQTNDQTNRIQVLDFNKFVARAHSSVHAFLDASEARITTQSVFMQQGSRQEAQGVFKEDIVSWLPYHFAGRQAPEAYSGFMIDDERLVGLRVSL